MTISIIMQLLCLLVTLNCLITQIQATECPVRSPRNLFTGAANRVEPKALALQCPSKNIDVPPPNPTPPRAFVFIIQNSSDTSLDIRGISNGTQLLSESLRNSAYKRYIIYSFNHITFKKLTDTVNIDEFVSIIKNFVHDPLTSPCGTHSLPALTDVLSSDMNLPKYSQIYIFTADPEPFTSAQTDNLPVELVRIHALFHVLISRVWMTCDTVARPNRTLAWRGQETVNPKIVPKQLKPIWDKMADFTTGHVFTMRKNVIEDFVNFYIPRTLTSILAAQAEYGDCSNAQSITFPIDLHVTKFTVAVGGDSPNVVVKNPNGDTATPNLLVNDEKWQYVYAFDKRSVSYRYPGTWTVHLMNKKRTPDEPQITGPNPCWVQVRVNGDLDAYWGFTSFNSSDVPRDPGFAQDHLNWLMAHPSKLGSDGKLQTMGLYPLNSWPMKTKDYSAENRLACTYEYLTASGFICNSPIGIVFSGIDESSTSFRRIHTALCDSIQCKNGGTPFGRECTCPYLYQDVDCGTIQCLNNAQTDGKKCCCVGPWTGLHCEISTISTTSTTTSTTGQPTTTSTTPTTTSTTPTTTSTTPSTTSTTPTTTSTTPTTTSTTPTTTSTTPTTSSTTPTTTSTTPTTTLTTPTTTSTTPTTTSTTPTTTSTTPTTTSTTPTTTSTTPTTTSTTPTTTSTTPTTTSTTPTTTSTTPTTTSTTPTTTSTTPTTTSTTPTTTSTTPTTTSTTPTTTSTTPTTTSTTPTTTSTTPTTTSTTPTTTSTTPTTTSTTPTTTSTTPTTTSTTPTTTSTTPTTTSKTPTTTSTTPTTTSTTPTTTSTTPSTTSTTPTTTSTTPSTTSTTPTTTSTTQSTTSTTPSTTSTTPTTTSTTPTTTSTTPSTTSTTPTTTSTTPTTTSSTTTPTTSSTSTTSTTAKPTTTSTTAEHTTTSTTAKPTTTSTSTTPTTTSKTTKPTTTSKTPTTSSGPRTTTSIRPPFNDCFADIVFLIETSERVGPLVQSLFNAALNLTKTIRIAHTGNWAAFAHFSSPSGNRSKLEINLERNNTYKEFSSLVNKIDIPSIMGISDIDLGLRIVRDHILVGGHERPNNRYPNYVILFSDGFYDNADTCCPAPFEIAAELRKNSTIFAVEVANIGGSHENLVNITGSEKNVYQLIGPAGLYTEIAHRIINEIQSECPFKQLNPKWYPEKRPDL